MLDHVQNQLKRVVELADSLGGQYGISICTTKLAAEAKVVESLKTAINTGGWYNQGAERGDYDNYQSPSTSELRPLEMAINDCARLSGGVNTEMGRLYYNWGLTFCVCVKLLFQRSARRILMNGPQWKRSWRRFRSRMTPR